MRGSTFNAHRFERLSISIVAPTLGSLVGALVGAAIPGFECVLAMQSGDSLNDEDELYQERILDHFEDPYHRGACTARTHTHEDDNPLCGDFIHVELAISPDGKVTEAFFDGDGCCISQASASMLMERIEGHTVDEVKNFTANDMLALFGAKLTPNRQKCCLLSWRVVQQAIYSPVKNQATTSAPAEPEARSCK